MMHFLKPTHTAVALSLQQLLWYLDWKCARHKACLAYHAMSYAALMLLVTVLIDTKLP